MTRSQKELSYRVQQLERICSSLVRHSCPWHERAELLADSHWPSDTQQGLHSWPALYAQPPVTTQDCLSPRIEADEASSVFPLDFHFTNSWDTPVQAQVQSASEFGMIDSSDLGVTNFNVALESFYEQQPWSLQIPPGSDVDAIIMQEPCHFQHCDLSSVPLDDQSTWDSLRESYEAVIPSTGEPQGGPHSTGPIGNDMTGIQDMDLWSLADANLPVDLDVGADLSGGTAAFHGPMSTQEDEEMASSEPGTTLAVYHVDEHPQGLSASSASALDLAVQDSNSSVDSLDPSSMESGAKTENRAAPRLPQPIEPNFKEIEKGFYGVPPQWKVDKFIYALGILLRQGLNPSRGRDRLCQNLTIHGIRWVIERSWPSSEIFWRMSGACIYFSQLEAWRNFPSKKRYSRLPPYFRPTWAQLHVPHSAFIDWMPWPELRDRIILHQDHIDIDLLVRTALLNVVSPRRVKSSVMGRVRNKKDSLNCNSDGPGSPSSECNVSFRVWDLCLLEKQNGSITPSPRNDKRSTLEREWRRDCSSGGGRIGARSKATSKGQEPFHKSYNAVSEGVQVIQKIYDLMCSDLSSVKLDRRFFEEYPFLYCDSAVSQYKVQKITSIIEEDVGPPTDIEPRFLSELKAIVESNTGTELRLAN
ncbi:uncharacterized protein Z520_00894 [Fonsecaea multimorphosa CBS 102226]|uniref:Uncharacterized protein n=1 Tax=Fonsecaea multimorphosa CBS 102226 TaxID=1442371 RepID=A0A0D2HQS6_9EURO|nr:uncharacterized protein Z520_00894 [Fonsecaea multimorphosa CBS 102226]KIY04201.1 hypothetical protein Z520_00894 [Fonsecaea multimorphosa CBS 102226]OAL32030.1 hypothetical protein AYO22_00900 [Fonsecaea multimorphosa]